MKSVINRRINIEYKAPYVVQFTTQLYQREFRVGYLEDKFIIDLVNMRKMKEPILIYPEIYAEPSWDLQDEDAIKADLVFFIRANINSIGQSLVGVVSFPNSQTFSVSVPVN